MEPAPSILTGLAAFYRTGGGIADKPGNEPDVFHTFFGLAGLSLLGTDGMAPVDAAHAMPVSVMQRLRAQQQQAAEGPG
tara:strand:- start:451 stop:687 length:237 start_codon:yes stop_codon:yes gene_type:complete